MQKHLRQRDIWHFSQRVVMEHHRIRVTTNEADNRVVISSDSWSLNIRRAHHEGWPIDGTEGFEEHEIQIERMQRMQKGDYMDPDGTRNIAIFDNVNGMTQLWMEESPLPTLVIYLENWLFIFSEIKFRIDYATNKAEIDKLLDFLISPIVEGPDWNSSKILDSVENASTAESPRP